MTATPNLRTGHYCYYIDASQDVSEHGGYVPSIVVRDESGHYPMLGNGVGAAPWVWGTDLKVAQEIAADRNARLGLNAEDVTEIVASSMCASMRGRGRQPVNLY